MRIVYISSPSFADCDFPLVHTWQKQKHDVHFFMELPCYSLRSNIININKQKPVADIISATNYDELIKFQKYIDFEKFYIINRIHASSLHPSTINLQYKLVSAIKKIEPDVIIMTSVPDMFRCLIYCFKKKIILTVHDPFPHTGEKNFRKLFFRNIAFKTINKFVLLNSKQKELFIKHWKLKKEQVCLTKLGPYECTNLFLTEDKLHDNKLNILFYGRISPYKGIEYLCKAMKIVHEHIPDAILTIAGSGKFYFDIASYAKLPYINIINHYISTEELATLLNRCTINVCPYTDATQSGVVLTSFAMNKPVIATNVGGMSEYIEDGKTGILVQPKDYNSLADAIIKILNDPTRLQNMEKEIIKRNNSEENGWEGIAHTYIKFISK